MLVRGHTHSRFYPHPASFTDENGQFVRFEYLEMLEGNDPARVTYKAKVSEDIVVVKFVSRYSKEMHEFLAAQGYTPRLRYCGPLPNVPNAQEYFTRVIHKIGAAWTITWSYAGGRDELCLSMQT